MQVNGTNVTQLATFNLQLVTLPMPERAKVTSLEAIEAFRARLIVYRERAGRVLDGASQLFNRVLAERGAHCRSIAST